MPTQARRELQADPPGNTLADELLVPSHWQTVDVLSDTHLDAHDPGTFLCWRHYLETTPAQAVLILGDWFEVWIGDDALNPRANASARHEGLNFASRVVRTVRFASERLAVFVMAGNRDFLLGDAALLACNAKRLNDPTVLSLGIRPEQRVLLSHGDAWCTDDRDYMAFRAMVRGDLWQSSFLKKPLSEREKLALEMREQSKKSQAQKSKFDDVNTHAVEAAALRANAAVVVHGHTHEGKSHKHPKFDRYVTFDWHKQALAPGANAPTGTHAQVLRLTRTPQNAWDIQRVDV